MCLDARWFVWAPVFAPLSGWGCASSSINVDADAGSEIDAEPGMGSDGAEGGPGGRDAAPAPTALAPGSSQPFDHRPVAVACGPVAEPGPSNGGVCTQHSDCVDAPRGRCAPAGDACFYDECWKDDDCGVREVCVCPDHPLLGLSYARCLPASCTTDEGCPGSARCRPAGRDCNGGGLEGYYCESPADACAAHDDCEGGAYCLFDPIVAHRVCYRPTSCTLALMRSPG